MSLVTDTVALQSVVEGEPLLDIFDKPQVNKKVEACKEALYSSAVGAAWGLATGLPIAALAYANGGVAEFLAVGAVADTVAGAVGALFGTIAKNCLAPQDSRPIARAIIAGYGTSAVALSICNATLAAVGINRPLWLQFAVGVPACAAGALAAGCIRPRVGRMLSGFLASAGTGCLTGVSLGKILSLAMPQVGTKVGPMLGLIGVQGMCGYIIADDKFKRN